MHACMPRTSPVVSLAESERAQLAQWVAAHGTPQQVALRCAIVLSAAAGGTNLEIGEQHGVDVKTVALWRGRYLDRGLEGLWEIAAGHGTWAQSDAFAREDQGDCASDLIE